MKIYTKRTGNTLATGSGDSLIAVPFLQFNNNVRERGGRELWELHATYFYKGLSVLGAGQRLQRLLADAHRPPGPSICPYRATMCRWATFDGGDASRSVALVEPLRPFDLRRGRELGPGALELQFRYSELQVGNEVFTGRPGRPNLWSTRLRIIDMGFNWYLNRNVNSISTGSMRCSASR